MPRRGDLVDQLLEIDRAAVGAGRVATTLPASLMEK